MSSTFPRSSDRRFATTALSLEVLLSVGALAGGAARVLGPRGEILPLPVSALAGSPFDSYLLPGVVLFAVLGIGPLVAADLARRRHALAPTAALAVGIALLGWLAVEIAVIGFSMTPPLQPIYLVLGAAITLVGLAWVRQART